MSRTHEIRFLSCFFQAETRTFLLFSALFAPLSPYPPPLFPLFFFFFLFVVFFENQRYLSESGTHHYS